ncbi:MAG: UDP-N-acetyl glucosamine 2-epimerase, partial [Candidatus Kapaibacteriota bacterium]
GFPEENIFFVGNTMIDSLHFALPKAEKSTVLQELELNKKEYGLVTMHRPSNVDDPAQLKSLLEILAEISSERDIVFPMHPRTSSKIREYGYADIIRTGKNLLITHPKGYIDFLALMKDADFVLTDSGGIQEETTVLGIPCITARTTTERPVTVEMGTNILIQPNPEAISRALHDIVHLPRKQGSIPPLWDGNAAERIADILVTQCIKAQ